LTRLDDLMEELSPDGVEFRPLGELLDYEQPGKYLVGTTSYNRSYAIPVLTAGQTFTLGYTDEADGVYPASLDKPVIIFDDFTTAFKWVDFPFKAKSSAMKMLTPKHSELVDLRYAYYVMQTIKYAPQDHARQWIGKYSRFRVPVPPLEVQREIVQVLNCFTELGAELEAEREARRRLPRHARFVRGCRRAVGISWCTWLAVPRETVHKARPGSCRRGRCVHPLR
jgi:type I restriction enzyme, S subunit